MDTLNQSRNPLTGGPASILSGGTRSLMAAPTMSSQFLSNNTSGLNGNSVLSNATFGFTSGPSNSSLWSSNDLIDTVKPSSGTNKSSSMWPLSGNGAPDMPSSALGSLAKSNTNTNALQSQQPCHIDTWKSPSSESNQNNIWASQNAYTNVSATSDPSSSNMYSGAGLGDSGMSTSGGDALKNAPGSSTSGSVHGSVGGSTGQILSRHGRGSSSERLQNAREELTPAEVAARAEQQRKIDELINNPHGWSSHTVDQTTEWDTSMLKEKFKDSGTTRRGDSHTESNVWCAGPPTGVNVWEDHYESVGQNTQRWNRSNMNALPGTSTVPSLTHPVQPGLPWESGPVAVPTSLEGSHVVPGNIIGSGGSVINRGILPTFNSNMVNPSNLPSKLPNVPHPSSSMISNPLNRSEPSTRAVYLEKLKAMGFSATVANDALIRCDMDWEKTLGLLVSGSLPSQTDVPISSNNVYSSGFTSSNAFSTTNNVPARQNVVVLEQTLQALINQEKNIVTYMDQNKTRLHELSQRICLIPRSPVAAQNPHILQTLQVDYNQLMQQHHKLESMQNEVRYKMNTIRQRILQAQAEAQQQQQHQHQQVRNLAQPGNMNLGNSYGLSLPGSAPNMTIPQPSSTSVSNYPNPSVFSSHGVRLPSSGYMGNTCAVINGPSNQKPVPPRNFLPQPMNDPSSNFSSNIPPPQTFPTGISYPGSFQSPSQVPISGNNQFLAGNATPTAGASSGLMSSWTVSNTPSMDSILSQMEEMKISNQASNNNLNDIPEFVPGQRWSGIKDDSTTVLSSTRNFFAVKTDHLERLAHSPADNEAVSPPHSARLPVNNPTPLMNGHANMSSWFVINEFPANNHNAVEYYRHQLAIQINKLSAAMANGSVDALSTVVRCHWHPIQRWLLICISDGPDGAHIQALLQSHFMPPTKVEILSDKQVRHYLNQLRPLENAPRPMLGSNNVYSAQVSQTQPSHMSNLSAAPLPPYNQPTLGNTPANYFTYPSTL